MNLFRSEEHLARWLEANAYEAGATLTAEEICDLAQAWWSDRLAPDWQPHTLEQNQAILDELGLTGEFWRLA
jgi:hypothetical protein